MLTISCWEEPPRARHQVARALTHHGHVIFVARNRIGAPALAERVVEKNITVVEPSWPLDYRFRYRLPGVNEIYQSWLLHRLRNRHRDVQVITFDHTVTGLGRHYPDYVYFCNDDFIGNSKFDFIIANLYHRQTEARVARHARTVVATSPYLVDKLSRFNPNTHEIPLGAPSVTDEQLAAALPRQGEKFRIGLVGFIGRRTPVSLLNKLLDEIEGSTLSLVGPIEKGYTDNLIHRERICMPGVLTGDDLVREISSFDVAIAPYDLSKVNKGGTPNKIWQYLAVGRPVVVTNLPNISHWSFPDGCVYTARDDDEFVSFVRRARNEDTLELLEKRIACARENTWDRRIDRLLNLMGQRSD